MPELPSLVAVKGGQVFTRRPIKNAGGQTSAILMFRERKELEKRSLARRREVHNAAAGIAARPACRQHRVEERGTERACEVIAPLAPVQAAAAERAAGGAEFCQIYPDILDEALTALGEPDRATIE